MQRALCARDRPIRNARCLRPRVSGASATTPAGREACGGRAAELAAFRDVVFPRLRAASLRCV